MPLKPLNLMLLNVFLGNQLNGTSIGFTFSARPVHWCLGLLSSLQYTYMSAFLLLFIATTISNHMMLYYLQVNRTKGTYVTLGYCLLLNSWWMSTLALQSWSLESWGKCYRCWRQRAPWRQSTMTNFTTDSWTRRDRSTSYISKPALMGHLQK